MELPLLVDEGGADGAVERAGAGRRGGPGVLGSAAWEEVVVGHRGSRNLLCCSDRA